MVEHGMSHDHIERFFFKGQRSIPYDVKFDFAIACELFNLFEVAGQVMPVV